MPDDMLITIVAAGRQNDIPLYIHAINIEEYERAVAVEPRAIVHGLEDPVPQNSDLPAKLKQNRYLCLFPPLSLFKAVRYP